MLEKHSDKWTDLDSVLDSCRMLYDQPDLIIGTVMKNNYSMWRNTLNQLREYAPKIVTGEQKLERILEKEDNVKVYLEMDDLSNDFSFISRAYIHDYRLPYICAWLKL